MDIIEFHLIAQDGFDLLFRVRRSVKISRVMELYCQRNVISLRETQFFFNGSLVNNNDTPESLHMRENDVINVIKLN